MDVFISSCRKPTGSPVFAHSHLSMHGPRQQPKSPGIALGNLVCPHWNTLIQILSASGSAIFNLNKTLLLPPPRAALPCPTSGTDVRGHQHLLFALSEALYDGSSLLHHHFPTEQCHLVAFLRQLCRQPASRLPSLKHRERERGVSLGGSFDVVGHEKASPG